jgi:hypothetical protein
MIFIPTKKGGFATRKQKENSRFFFNLLPNLQLKKHNIASFK